MKVLVVFAALYTAYAAPVADPGTIVVRGRIPVPVGNDIANDIFSEMNDIAKEISENMNEMANEFRGNFGGSFGGFEDPFFTGIHPAGGGFPDFPDFSDVFRQNQEIIDRINQQLQAGLDSIRLQPPMIPNEEEDGEDEEEEDVEPDQQPEPSVIIDDDGETEIIEDAATEVPEIEIPSDPEVPTAPGAPAEVVPEIQPDAPAPEVPVA